MSDYPTLFREYQVEDVIRDYLQSQGVAAAPKKLHGADIDAKDAAGRGYVIEVEGNQKPDGKPFTTSQKYTHFRRAVGQICSRMRDDSTIYAIGLPTDEDYVSGVRDISMARRRLGLYVYFVNGEKKIIELRPEEDFSSNR